MIKSVKGTSDIASPEVLVWQHVEKTMATTAKAYGYEEIRTPTIEMEELFSTSVGQGTDIVEKEMYAFPDKKGRHLVLRPEGTAATCRAYLEHQMNLQPSPAKFYYMGSFFRYEQPQGGRKREFHSFGVEALGEQSPLQDAEVIDMVMTMLSRLGLSHLSVDVNSIGDDNCRPAYKDALRASLATHEGQLCEDCRRRMSDNPLRILDCKREDPALLESLPKSADYLCTDCEDHFHRLLSTLEALKIPYHLNHRLVRGLDYYTRTVFEVISEDLGAQNALLGGGRYDYLIRHLGGPATPAVGWGLGLERLVSVLTARYPELLGSLAISRAYIVHSDTTTAAAFQLRHALADTGWALDVDVRQDGFGKQLARASKRGARIALILGEDEIAAGTCTMMPCGYERFAAFLKQGTLCSHLLRQVQKLRQGTTLWGGIVMSERERGSYAD
ncbi:MAG: histidine--tRNA ligase [Caldiserica bacterium]|nr:histidine--tRNA ligase [Caldisericota bacterium]